jgi:alpha-beta hydrolase superfamily lysophospholipase
METVMKREFYFLSKDEKTKIHAIEWIPEGPIKAVLQMCHGMVEFIDRYDVFAQFLASNGFYVVGHDHLGHGKSVTTSSNLGFFDEKNGNACVVGDIHQLRIMTEKKYPQLPYFMMGHSMGSFLVRQYIGTYGVGLSGAIIMGTGDQPTMILQAGKAVCRWIALFKGWKCRSTLVDGMACGAYEKEFDLENDGSNWLTKDPEVVKKYRLDPTCGFMFTVNAYFHMFDGMVKMNKQEKAGKIPKSLPIVFVSGKDDPVGEFGKGVRKVFKRYKATEMKDVRMKLYEGDRHEILNEFDKEDVYNDLLRWLEAHI